MLDDRCGLRDHPQGEDPAVLAAGDLFRSAEGIEFLADDFAPAPLQHLYGRQFFGANLATESLGGEADLGDARMDLAGPLVTQPHARARLFNRVEG